MFYLGCDLKVNISGQLLKAGSLSGCGVGAIISGSSAHDLFSLVLVVGHVRKELVVDLGEFSLKFLGNLVLILDSNLRLLHLFAETFRDVETLLSARFSLENVAHNFLLLGVQRGVVERSAQRDHVHVTVSVTNGRH